MWSCDDRGCCSDLPPLHKALPGPTQEAHEGGTCRLDPQTAAEPRSPPGALPAGTSPPSQRGRLRLMLRGVLAPPDVGQVPSGRTWTRGNPPAQGRQCLGSLAPLRPAAPAANPQPRRAAGTRGGCCVRGRGKCSLFIISWNHFNGSCARHRWARSTYSLGDHTEHLGGRAQARAGGMTSAL